MRLNNRLRHELPPERLIDFHSPMVPGSDFGDAIQMNQAGQNKRGQTAWRELQN